MRKLTDAEKAARREAARRAAEAAEERRRQRAAELAGLVDRSLDAIASIAGAKDERFLEELMSERSSAEREDIIRFNRDNALRSVRQAVLDVQALKWMEEAHERLKREER